MSFSVVYDSICGEIISCFKDQDNQVGPMNPGTGRKMLRGLSTAVDSTKQFMLSQSIDENPISSDRILWTGDVIQSKTQIVADGIDSCVLSGLPADGYLRVNGDLVKLTETTYTVKSATAAGISVTLVGKYSSAVWGILALASADYIVAVRGIRDGLLRDSDWTQISDVPLSPIQVSAWKTYRQALRDLTNQTPPYTWPTPPS